MKALDRLLMRLVQGFALVAACAMLVMMGQVTLDVLLRWLANHPIDGTLELVANYYMVALIFLPLGLLTYTRDHITVELFTRHMGERPLAVLDLLGNVVALIYVGVLIWMGTLEAWDMTLIGETWFHTVQDETRVTLFNAFFPGLGIGIGDYSLTRRDAYETVDLRLGVQNERWVIHLVGKNLGDETYLEEVTTAPELGGSFIHPGTERRVSVEIGYRF